MMFLAATKAQPTSAMAARVVVVKASDAEPYSQAETSVRARLVEGKHEVRTLLLKELADKGVGLVGTPELVVAVGTPAARWLHKQLPPRAGLSTAWSPTPKTPACSKAPTPGA